MAKRKGESKKRAPTNIDIACILIHMANLQGRKTLPKGIKRKTFTVSPSPVCLPSDIYFANSVKAIV